MNHDLRTLDWDVYNSYLYDSLTDLKPVYFFEGWNMVNPKMSCYRMICMNILLNTSKRHLENHFHSQRC